MSSKGKIFVTGVDGFVASACTDLLLKSGYSVKGTVRTQAKADKMAAVFSAYKDKIEFVLTDLGKPNAFDNLLDNGITGIFHVALVAPEPNLDIATQILDPSRLSTINLLDNASKFPSIKRVVITSTIATIIDFTKLPPYTFSEKDWTTFTYEAAVQTKNPLASYSVSKLLQEKTALDYVAEKKPQFDVVVINPIFIYGPTVQQINSKADLSASPSRFYDVFAVKTEAEPANHFSGFVDVRDVALAHLLAFENPKASGQRYLLSSSNFCWQEIANLIHKYFPGKCKIPSAPVPPYEAFTFDTTKSQQELGLKYRTLETSFKDMAEQFVNLQNQGKL